MRGAAAILALAIFAIAPDAQAYTQNSRLERDLSRSDPNALALFPAKGFKNGAAGFFNTHALYVVPGSVRAWCTNAQHGILEPGCYVELYVQGKGIKPRNSRGDSCGSIGRWYQAPGSRHYLPTPGSFIATAMASGEWERVEVEIYEGAGAKALPSGTCDRTINAKPRID
jgi:hypothetical protein